MDKKNYKKITEKKKNKRIIYEKEEFADIDFWPI